MDAQLQGIIDRIQQDGVRTAEEKAAEIIAKAEETARERVESARKEADTILEQAESERQRLLASGNAALQQSARDLILSVKAQLTAIFSSLIADEAGTALSAERMAVIIGDIVKGWSSGEAEVLVAESVQSELEASLRSSLSDKLASGITVRPVASSAAGFRVGKKDGSVHFDFTDESIAEILSQYLNPRLAALIEESAKG